MLFCLGQRWTHHHISVFILTFMGYAFFHATRKAFSNIKTVIISEWTPTSFNSSTPITRPDETWNSRRFFKDEASAEYFLGALDSIFMVCYAIGLYINGAIGDRLDTRKVLSFGMIGSSITVILFGCVSEWTHFYSKPYYVAWWVLNGFLQSTGWPACVAVMGYWVGKSSRGLVLGLWSACASVGNIIGALLCSSVLNYGYSYSFLLPSTVLLGGGIVILFGLVVYPADVGLEDPDSHVQSNRQHDIDDSARERLLDDNEDIQGSKAVLPDQNKAISVWRALLLPGVIPYSLAYGCLKLVNYSFFFWLPLYLHSQFGWKTTESDKLSIWYDVGGIIVGTIAGFISDLSGRRAPVMTVLLVLAMPMLYFYKISPNDKKINAILMTLLGGFIGGPSNLISAAISADLGRQTVVQGNERALSTVTGIVDGTGSVGAAIGQFLLPIFHQKLGWGAVFYFFMIMTGSTLLCIVPIIYNDFKEHGFRCCSKRTQVTGFQNEETSEEDVILNRE